MLAPSEMSILGGAEKPNDLATFMRSSLCTSKTDRRLCDAYAWRYDLYPSFADCYSLASSIEEKEKDDIITNQYMTMNSDMATNQDMTIIKTYLVQIVILSN